MPLERNVFFVPILAVWAVTLAAISVHAFIYPESHSVYPIYVQAARSWRTEGDLYRDLREPYRYSPSATALLMPLSWMPDQVGGVFWRWLNAGVFLTGLGYWSKTFLRKKRGLLFLLVLPLTLGNLHNGQCNPLLFGLILASFAAIQRRHWLLAGGGIALAALFKPYLMVFGLLLGVLHPRRIIAPLVAALGAGLALPFLFKQPDYVARQYADWGHTLLSEDRSGWTWLLGYRDFWLLVRVWHLPVSRQAYLVLQILSGICSAGLCLMTRSAPPARKNKDQSLVNFTLALGTCWILLCGPATESATYLFLGPVLGWALVQTDQPDRSLRRIFLMGAYALVLISALAVWFPGGKALHAIGLQPLAALVAFLILVLEPLRVLVQNFHSSFMLRRPCFQSFGRDHAQ